MTTRAYTFVSMLLLAWIICLNTYAENNNSRLQLWISDFNWERMNTTHYAVTDSYTVVSRQHHRTTDSTTDQYEILNITSLNNDERKKIVDILAEINIDVLQESYVDPNVVDGVSLRFQFGLPGHACKIVHVSNIRIIPLAKLTQVISQVTGEMIHYHQYLHLREVNVEHSE